jgi:3-oxoacyl-[acyl-carrier-protein] synthase-3
VLLITADVYTKYLHPKDRTTRTIFGDGATATLVQGITTQTDERGPLIGPFVYGTDGRGAPNLIVRAGGLRQPRTSETAIPKRDAVGSFQVDDNLYMNGAELFTFTIREVPRTVYQTLAAAGLTVEDVDLFVFHQANQFMLEHLRSQLGIPPDKFCLAFAQCGNTVSSSIPIALHGAQMAGLLRSGHRVLLLGFGVGYSWAGAVLRWVAFE